jgi:hypothetical protein
MAITRRAGVVVVSRHTTTLRQRRINGAINLSHLNTTLAQQESSILDGGNGNDVSVDTIPEPTTLLLALLALAAAPLRVRCG